MLQLSESGTHTVRNCLSKTLCYICKNKHHISICEKKLNERERQSEFSSTTNVVGRENNILLQTARASIMTFNSNNQSCEARCLFDNCSQKSFITAELRERLNIKTVRTEHLRVKTFGTSEESIQNLEVNSWTLISRHFRNVAEKCFSANVPKVLIFGLLVRTGTINDFSY